MTIFLTSLLITISMLVEKLFFFRLENKYANSFLGILEISVYSVILIISIFSFFLQKKSSPIIKQKINLLSSLFGIGALFFIFTSFYLNYQKVSIHWDAVALYDARAKFISNGMKFSDMPNLAKFDNLNEYYYLLYPPYTSIAHFMWETSSLTRGIQVSVYYSVIFAILSMIIYLVAGESFGLLIATIITFLFVSNSSVFNVVVKEYTNLPFDLYIIGGVLLIYSSIKKNEIWKYGLGILMVATSLWVRLLEPIWLAIFMAYFIATYSRKNISKWLFLTGIFLATCLLEYCSWNYFTSSIAHNPGFLNFTRLNILDTFVGVFTGAPLVVASTMAKSWGIPLLIHILALLSLILRPKYAFENKQLLFIGLVILFSILVYFSEFYVLSFQADWWSIVTMSLDRSSTFLIPMSLFVLFNQIKSSKN